MHRWGIRLGPFDVIGRRSSSNCPHEFAKAPFELLQRFSDCSALFFNPVPGSRRLSATSVIILVVVEVVPRCNDAVSVVTGLGPWMAGLSHTTHLCARTVAGFRRAIGLPVPVFPCGVHLVLGDFAGPTVLRQLRFRCPTPVI